MITDSSDIITALLESFCPSSDLLQYLVQCSDLDTADQFLDRYCKPIQVVLDSGGFENTLDKLTSLTLFLSLPELVWPLPNRLFPYD